MTFWSDEEGGMDEIGEDECYEGDNRARLRFGGVTEVVYEGDISVIEALVDAVHLHDQELLTLRTMILEVTEAHHQRLATLQAQINVLSMALSTIESTPSF